MSQGAYMQARREGLRVAHACQSRGEIPTLPVLAELVPELNRLTQVPLGLVQIAMNQIEGTATKGRTAAFAKGFLPLLEPDSEFAVKWSTLYDGVVEEGLRQPITALEYYNRYYVVEGNKRVSVMRRLDAVLVEANVTRVLPQYEDSERYRVYQEFLKFYAETGISYVLLDHEGDYARLLRFVGKSFGEPWTAEELFDFQSCYYRFAQAYTSHVGARLPMGSGNAFLTYLGVFGYAGSVSKTPSEFSAEIARIASEFAVAAAGKPAALIADAETPEPTLMTSVKSVLRRPPRTLRCAFLYNSSPDRSGWTYWHELGRKALQKAFGERVTTARVDNVRAADSPDVIEKLIKDGHDVIFAASPVFLEACIRQSALHPDIKLLNCSLLASYHNVRSYYLRIYEAKFILGAIAGAMADNNLIGYIADYPIYGTPASINAFALGVQMTNPRARVMLDWSTLPGHDPERSLAAQGVRLFSSRDIRAPHVDTHSFGLYSFSEGETVNLAMPVWNWGRLYERIVRSIFSNAWAEESEQNADRALSYYLGMSSDAIDLICSKKLPARLRRLADLLRERIRAGAFLPFVGPIYDQNGALRVEEDDALTPQTIIDMDYLAANVEGRLPGSGELTDVARGLVSLQGVSEKKDAGAWTDGPRGTQAQGAGGKA